MTIRKFLQRRVLTAYLLVVGSLAILFAGPLGASNEARLTIIVVGLFSFVGAFLFMNFAVRCPRCKGNLAITPVILPFHVSPKRRANFCTFCGVSFDEKALGQK